MFRLRIELSDKEHEALVGLSEFELRAMCDTARFLIRDGLRLRGLLPPDDIASALAGIQLFLDQLVSVDE
jgi:hypothetical protein